MRIRYLFLLVVSGCGADLHTPEVIEEARGDTLVVISTGVPELGSVDSIEVFWQADELGDPGSMALTDDHLVVGDGDRIHVLARGGGEARSFGGSGEGPGEFRSIGAVGSLGADTVAAYDTMMRRLSQFSWEGEYLGSRAITPHESFLNPSQHGEPLVRVGNGILWTRTENLHLGQPMRMALLWHDLHADSSAVVEVWDDRRLEQLSGGLVGPRELFPPRAIVAVGRDGRVAEGNGTEYCIRMRRVFEHSFRVWCRERAPVPIGEGIRSPDLAPIADDPRADLLQEAWADQTAGDVLPHFDRMLFAESGELWVRTIHEAMADLHPTILSLRPETGPPWREWEVFGDDGRLQRVVRFPGDFDPRAIEDGAVFGFLTLETGEIAIGRADVW